jgi:lactoylglutathione lyase
MPKVCVVSIYVSDMGLAKNFYCEKLGFEVDEVYDESIISLKQDGVALILCKAESNTSVEYPLNSQVIIGIETEDLVSTMTAYKAQGIEFIYDTPQPCPPGTFNAFKDPFGNVIEVLEFAKG